MQNTYKLHYCTDNPIQYRYRKIKSVISALGCDVIDSPKQTFFQLKNLSPIPTLPLLQTPDGNIVNSNTIIRYLSSKHNNKLYGGDNLYHKALIDQWIDLLICDFDICTIAINIFIQGKQVQIQKVIEDAEIFINHLNKHLNNRKFIVGNELSIADLAVAATIAPVLSQIYGQNERKKYGRLNDWYHTITEQNKYIQPKILPKKMNKIFEKRINEKKGKTDKDGQLEGQQGSNDDGKKEKGKNKEKAQPKQENVKEKKCEEKPQMKPKQNKKQKSGKAQTVVSPQTKTEHVEDKITDDTKVDDKKDI